jgi:hypothetical protein
METVWLDRAGWMGWLPAWLFGSVQTDRHPDVIRWIRHFALQHAGAGT